MNRLSALCSILLSFSLFGQSSGNINFQSKYHAPDEVIDVQFIPGNDVLIQVTGLNNVKADNYIAFFNVTQSGENAEEANRLIDDRINHVREAISDIEGVSLFVDMISFVPVYEFQKEKKLFSKKTYNEIPKGFELKKNLHISFSSNDQLAKLISICAKEEIYDLIRVDYVCNDIENQKKILAEKANVLIKEKMKRYADLIGADFSNLQKQFTDGYKVYYPVEQYDAYHAFSSSSLNLDGGEKINRAHKSKTLYYQPLSTKEFDFILNPAVSEPVIQIVYELKIKIALEPKVSSDTSKEYVVITPNGQLRSLQLEN